MTLDEFKTECDKVADEMTTKVADLLTRAVKDSGLDPKLVWAIFENSMSTTFERIADKAQS